MDSFAFYRDRIDAGRQLARRLEEYRDTDAVLLGMARGGVAVARGVADVLHLPLQPLIVRKIGATQNPELAIGAVSETGALWLDGDIVRATGASKSYIERETETQMREARRRKEAYGPVSHPEIVAGRPAIVVDDGIATGASAVVALRSARDLGASEVILATPVASRQAVRLLEEHADRVVVLATPDPFMAVGMFYERFDQVSDAEVTRFLQVGDGAASGTP